MGYEAWVGRRLSRRGAVAIVVLVGAALSAGPAYGQRGTGRMQGKIVDEDGNPVAGVEVTVFNPDVTPDTLTATSNENGGWAVLGLKRARWKFTFVKDGYTTAEINADVAGSRNPDMDLTLHPVMATAAGGMAEGMPGIELFQEGGKLFDAGDYEGAIAKWNEFLLMNPDVYLIQGNLGNAYRELGDIAAARAAYEQLLLNEPDNSMGNYNLGEMLIEEGEIDAAMPLFDKVLESSPDDPAVYYNVAELYFSQREAAAAVQYYQRAIEVDAGYLPAHKQMGFAYINSGDIPAAIAAFEKFIELAPVDNPDLPLVKDVLAALKSG